MDVWSLGILFYEMTHFKTPFKGMTLSEIQKSLKMKSIKFKSDFPNSY